MSRIAIYGDVSVNVIDGSSIWLASIVEVAANIFDEVHLILKFAPESDMLLQPLMRASDVSIHLPPPEVRESGRGHTPATAAAQIERLMIDIDIDVVLARGFDASWEFARSTAISSRLWAYVTDLPFPPERLSAVNVARLETITQHSRRMLAQTESSRSYLESIVPLAAGKTVLMPPMIPDGAFELASISLRDQDRGLEIIYAGKFAKEWRTLEMLELPRLLRTRGVQATLTMVGGKFQKDKIEPTWHERMHDALVCAVEDASSGVSWLGPLPREEVLSAISHADIGMGWRTSALDSSLEISTKALEYGAVGIVPLLNDTADHRSLYGQDYRAFVSGTATTEEVADSIAQLQPAMAACQRSAAEVSRRYSMTEAEQRLRIAFSRAGVALHDARVAIASSSVTNVLVASHDFKFMGEVMDALKAAPNVAVAVDAWDSLHQHDERASERLLHNADVVLCEWAGPNLAWYSRQVSPAQRLVGRLHGFELRSGTWLDSVHFDRVNAMVFVSEYYRERARERLNLSLQQAVVIPNMVDAHDLARPKLHGSQFRLGLVGFVPFLKRPDRAVALLEQLLQADERYFLHIRGRAPWEYPHHWQTPLERQLYLEFYRSIRASDALREHVVFEEFGADMASWLRKIGIVLSPSDHESFHLAPAEGLASGAEAIVWHREGSVDIFGRDRVYEDLAAAADRILSLREDVAFHQASRSAQASATEAWDPSRVLPQWSAALGLPQFLAGMTEAP